MTTVFLTLAIFAFVMLIMAIGVIMRRPCLRGSCGGPEVLTPDGEPLSCAACPNRKRRDEQPTQVDSVTSARALPVVQEARSVPE